jgi:peptide/nickel transport system permease protein
VAHARLDIVDIVDAGTRAAGYERRAEWRRFLASRRAVAGAILLGAVALAAVLAPVLAPYDPAEQRAASAVQPPSAAHLMGTDNFGRDVLSRALWGGRVSQLIGLLSMAVSVTVGVVVGGLAGFYGRGVDGVLMRATETVVTFPTFFLLITLVAVFGARLSLLVLAIGLTSWPITARVVRAECLTLREREFVQAARALGAGGLRIMARHLLPNVMPVIIVAATLRVAYVILVEAGLSYLGVGVPPPTASWGSMVADGREYLFRAWWISFFPGLFIFLTVMTYNLVGDGLRDALDPHGLVGGDLGRRQR